MIEMVQQWGRELEAVHRQIGRHFHRAEPRRWALAYLQGLMSSCARKNGWQLAEAIGDTTPDGVQRLLHAARWDTDAVRNDLRSYVLEHLAAPNSVLIIDETSFIKRGTKSVGVHHQYCGTTGELENCQVAVFLAYASDRGTAFIDRALFLPQAWARDQVRRSTAGVPDDVTFATKPELARAMLERAFDAGLAAGWVTADSLYGCDRRLRHALEERQQCIPLTVPEVCHLIWRLLWTRPAAQAAVLAWSRWRRRHQWRAQGCHARRRGPPY